MASRYYKISLGEFDSLMSKIGFNKVNTKHKEIVYDYSHPKNNSVGIRVYSSIDKRTSEARENGSDAIRCVYWSFRHDRPLASTKRVHRIETWESNLMFRLRTMAAVVIKMPTCKCGSHMVCRKGEYGKFWGCLSYPECKNTLKYANHSLSFLEDKAALHVRSLG